MTWKPTTTLKSLGLSNGDRVVKTHTRLRMMFYPHTDDPLRFSANPALAGNDENYSTCALHGTKTSKIEMSWEADTQATCKRFHWTKVMGQAAGSWTATIKDRPPYGLGLGEASVLPGDWCAISILRNDEEIPLCAGPVDSVRCQTEANPRGTVTRTYTLSGRDHGAAFDAPMAYQTNWVRTLGEMVNGLMTERVKNSVGGRPDQMFSVLIAAALDKGVTGTRTGQWTLPKGLGDGLCLIDTLTIKNRSTGNLRGSYWSAPQLWTQPGQTLHAALQYWCFALLNEIWYDWHYTAASRGFSSLTTIGGQPLALAANIRERPFPSTVTGLQGPWFSDGEACLTWKLPRWLCRSSDLQRSGLERFNLIELLADIGYGGGQSDQAAQFPPHWCRWSIERHGLKPMQETTHYIAQDGTLGKQWPLEREQWQKLLTDWYAINPWLTSGSLGFALALPEIRVGSRLVLENSNNKTSEQFYVEGIDLDWSGIDSPTTPARASTTFHVSRGWKGDDRSLMDAVSTISNKFEAVF